MRTTIQFQYDWDDRREMGHFARQRRLTFRQRVAGLLIQALILGTLLAFVLIYLQPDRTKWNTPLAKVSTAAFGCLWFAMVLRSLYVQAMRAGWIAAGPLTMVDISDDGLEVTIRKRTWALPWKSFIFFRESERGVYLIDGNERCILLPKSAFVTHVEYAQLIECAKQRVSGASQKAEAEVMAAASTPEFRAKHMHRAKLGFVGAILILIGMMVTFGCSNRLQREGDQALFIILGIIGGVALWASVELAMGKGFHPVDGVIAFLFPVLGIIFLATRADPMRGERINRRSLGAFLSTPSMTVDQMRGRR